jgi:hypothetical protein
MKRMAHCFKLNTPCECSLLLILILLVSAPARSHVGNPDVYVQGAAGPYHVVVAIRTPQMIPGRAEVEISSSTPGVSEITVVPVFMVGPAADHPPVADLLLPSKYDPKFFFGQVWLMESGSWQIRVRVQGAQGPGEFAVPVQAAARGTLPMGRSLSVPLFALMTLLVAAIISILGAARRESLLEPGQIPGPRNSRGSRWVMVGTAVIASVILLIGNRWWNDVALGKARQMIYRPPQLAVSLDQRAKIILRMSDSLWHTSRPETVMTGLIPDHGHLMHLFLIREPGLDRFYHLHPLLLNSQSGQNARSDAAFGMDLPRICAGRYQVFADVVRESGFADTMTAEIDLPEIAGVPLSADDSAATPPPLDLKNSSADIGYRSTNDAKSSAASMGAHQPETHTSNSEVTAILADGYRMVWEHDGELAIAKHFLWLRFRLETSTGDPAPDMETYMGMAGHMEIVSADRSVFAHVHPDGSVAMAALEMAQKRLPSPNEGLASDQGGSMSMGTSMGRPTAKVAFPYGFPKAGDYRIFVQMKHGGKIETGVFDTRVRP